MLSPNSGAAFDHVVWVTVDDEGALFAKMSGFLDKTGRIPVGGEDLCLQFEDCEMN